jgi:hypothetical protein
MLVRQTALPTYKTQAAAAACLVMAALVGLAPLMLTAQAPASSASTAETALPHRPRQGLKRPFLLEGSRMTVNRQRTF